MKYRFEHIHLIEIQKDILYNDVKLFNFSHLVASILVGFCWTSKDFIDEIIAVRLTSLLKKRQFNLVI